MSYRILTVALAAAGFVFATQSFAETTYNNSKSNNLRQGQAQPGGPAKSIAVNNSRSNTYKQGSPKGTGGPANKWPGATLNH